MSDNHPCFVNEIKRLGHTVITSDKIDNFSFPEQKHADMQVFPIKDKIFILRECLNLIKKLPFEQLIFCENEAGKKYPENILLNFLYLNNTLYGKLSAIDGNLLKFCKCNNINTVNVNQGYARCSALVVNEKAVITSDVSIEKALKQNGVEVLLISSGYITLNGYDYGFIGGAGGKLDENTVAFFGNIENHPDYKEIKTFCEKYNVLIKVICRYMPLTDIGGLVKLNN